MVALERDKTRVLKQGMMQELLTGRTRMARIIDHESRGLHESLVANLDMMMYNTNTSVVRVTS